jgi:hypothetical protein
MNTKNSCKAKIPALCRHHGVPRPALDVKSIKSELKSNDKDLKSITPGDFKEASRILERQNKLQSRLRFITGNRERNDNIHQIIGDMETEKAAYKDTALKTILGHGSVEYEAYTNDLEKKYVERAKDLPKFTFHTSEYDAPKSQTDQNKIDQRNAQKAADAWVEENGYNGTIKAKVGVFEHRIVPYKKEVGELTYKMWKEHRHSPRVQAAEAMINRVVAEPSKRHV